MPTPQRLLRVEALAKDQKLAANSLMNSEGLCTCGRFLQKTDRKFVIGQVNTNLFADPKGRNLLVMAAYCYDCATAINGLLKWLKGRHASEEPERKRVEG